MSAAIKPKGSYIPGRDAGAKAWAGTYLGSTVGLKIVVGLTGLALAGFTVFHMVGNLKMLPGGPAARESMNGYAAFLKHDLGALLWAARGGLLALFLAHVVITLRLRAKAAAARPVGYAHYRTAQATVASRTMLWTGVIVGLFVLFHLAHYTFGVVKDAPAPAGTGTVDYLALEDPKGRHDVYNMVIAGFSDPVLVAIYLLAQVLLFVHLSHGIPSAFQTLGVKSRRFAKAIWGLGVLTALVILVGNVTIVLAVYTGFLTHEYGPLK